MDKQLFSVLLNRLHGYPIEWISLNHYNEPLLDPGFVKKAHLIREHGLKLRLFTNGIALRPRLSHFLARLDVIESIVVNIPTQNPAAYRQRMGVPLAPGMIDQLRHAATAGLPITVCINGNDEVSTEWARQAQETLGSQITVHLNLTHDRAGLVKAGPDVATAGYWSGELGGCVRMLDHLHLNLVGEVFLCCQDYYQKHILGDLVQQSIEQVMTGPLAVRLRRTIFGADAAPGDLICRSCVELIRPCPSSKGDEAAGYCPHGGIT